MINPISSAAHGVSGAGGLNEAVVRFGAMQESREQQRTERATEEKDASPVDQAFLEAIDDLPEEGQAPTQQAGGGHATAQSQRTSSRDENSISGRGPGQDGAQEAQEQAIAQHAAEQHGKRELVKSDVDRSQRSTREMMGRIESKGGVEESHAPKSESQAPSSAHKSSGGGESHGSTGASGHKGAGPAGGGGGHAPAAAGGGPRVGGDVLAAAVGSGLATTEEIAPGSAQAKDSEDDHGQQEDSSQESVKARGEDQGKRVSRERSLDGQAGFHDGDGGREDSRKKFGQESPGGRQEGSRQQTAGGEQSDEQPHRGPAPESAAPPADAAEESSAAWREDSAAAPVADSSSSASAAAVDPSSAASQPPAQPAESAQPAASVASPASAPQPPQAPLVEAQPPTFDKLSVADAFERTAPAFSLGSDSLLGDEYFFFDDARTTPDAPASA